MANKLTALKTKFSASGLMKSRGTGANIAAIMKPVGKGDITPWERKRAEQGTQEFDAQFQIPDKPIYSDNEVQGAQMMAKTATEAATNKEKVVEAKLKISDASVKWYEADSKLVRGLADNSLEKFQQNLKTHEHLDAQAPVYMNGVAHYAREHQGALAVMDQIGNIEKSMALK